MTNGSDGFSSTTSYTNSLDNGLTPYTSTTGKGLSDPIAVIPKPSGSSLGYLQDLGKSFSFLNPHYHFPSFWSWSLTYEIAPTKRDAFSVSYIGNRVPNNPENNNINQISPQWNAQCDIERGGKLADTPLPTRSPTHIQGKSDFAGGDYYSPDAISGSY